MTPEEYFEIEPNFKYELTDVFSKNFDKKIADLIDFFGPCIAYSDYNGIKEYFCFEYYHYRRIGDDDAAIQFEKINKNDPKFVWIYDNSGQYVRYGMFFRTETDMILGKLLLDHS